MNGAGSKWWWCAQAGKTVAAHLVFHMIRIVAGRLLGLLES